MEAQMSATYGETVVGLAVDGRPILAGVYNEHQVRAAAGVTLVLGALAFVYAYFAKQYVPIQVVTVFFFVEFLVRVTAGLRYSPVGGLANVLAARQPPHWVSAKPKRFAWTLGLVMSLAMAVITNTGIRGPLPLTICLICMTLMWLEAVLGLCLGCEIYGLLVRRGWVAPDPAIEVCSGGACSLDGAAGAADVSAPTADER
jgi:hypothetical protein